MHSSNWPLILIIRSTIKTSKETTFLPKGIKAIPKVNKNLDIDIILTQLEYIHFDHINKEKTKYSLHIHIITFSSDTL